MNSRESIQRFLREVVTTTLGRAPTSKLQQTRRQVKQTYKQVKHLKKNCDENGPNLGDISSLQRTISDLFESCKELRLGGSCLHAKGPECVRCLSEHGRLVGKYVGFPDGLDMADFFYQRLVKLGKMDKHAEFIVQELDRISSELTKMDLLVKQSQELLASMEKEWNQLQKLKRKEPELNEQSVTVHEISAIRHEYDLETEERRSMENQLASNENEVLAESKTSTESSLNSRSLLVRVDTLHLQFCCVEKQNMVQTCKTQLRRKGVNCPVVICETLAKLKQFCQIQAERLTQRTYVIGAFAFAKNAADPLDGQCKVFTLFRDDDELIALDVVVKQIPGRSLTQEYELLSTNWPHIHSWGPLVSEYVRHHGVATVLDSLQYSLQLQGVGLGSTTLALLQEILRFRSDLRTLNLESNRLLDDSSFSGIAVIVARNPGLEHVKLGKNRGGGVSAKVKKELVQSINSTIAASLVSLDLSNIPFLCFTKHNTEALCQSWLDESVSLLQGLANVCTNSMSLKNLSINGIYTSQAKGGSHSVCKCARQPLLLDAMNEVSSAINGLSCLSTLNFFKNVVATEKQAQLVINMLCYPMAAIKHVKANGLCVLEHAPLTGSDVNAASNRQEASPIKLCLYQCENVPLGLDLSRIEILNLSEGNLGGVQTCKLFTALATNDTIKELLYRNNSEAFREPDPLEALMKVGLHNKQLRALYVGNSAFLESTPEQAAALQRFVRSVNNNEHSRLESLEVGATNCYESSAPMFKLQWLKQLFEKHNGFCSVHFWGAAGVVREFEDLFIQEQEHPYVNIHDLAHLSPGITPKVMAYSFPEGSLLTLLSATSA